MTHDLTLQEIIDCENLLLKNLIQFYEAEFSNITKKLPNEEGLFLLDTQLSDINRAFIAYSNFKPIGFTIVHVASESNSREILEFYILPCYRREYYGQAFSNLIFDTFKGSWVVKQLPEAKKAYSFWNRTISNYTLSKFEEDHYEDEYWGKVIRQRFLNE